LNCGTGNPVYLVYPNGTFNVASVNLSGGGALLNSLAKSLTSYTSFDQMKEAASKGNTSQISCCVPDIPPVQFLLGAMTNGKTFVPLGRLAS
jgi:pantothenate kinase